MTSSANVGCQTGIQFHPAVPRHYKNYIVHCVIWDKHAETYFLKKFLELL